MTGLIAERLIRTATGEFRQMASFYLASIIGGIAVVYACGIPWLSFVTGTPFGTALAGNLAFIPGDLLKAAIATLAARAVLAGYPCCRAGPDPARS